MFFINKNKLPGKIINADGKPFRGKKAAPITKIFKTGIRAVDAFLTIGYGQKMAMFGHRGTGQLTFALMLINNSPADVNIVSLVCDDASCVFDFTDDEFISPEARKKTIIVCSTPNESVEQCKKNIEKAISLCEYYRDKGKDVLFVNYSIENVISAYSNFCLQKGEPFSKNGYPISMTYWYSKLMNRCVSNDKGTITTIIAKTGLQQNELDDEMINMVRKYSDGHIFLSRHNAEQDIFPAVDILGSISRYQSDLLSQNELNAIRKLRKIFSMYMENEEFFNSDNYIEGDVAENDLIKNTYEEIKSFIIQRRQTNSSLEETMQKLMLIASSID